ncbi:hypothetical protein [Rurimicrobium arvi]|uniref:Uncharacterized protein n=1 Tax=Rurimicrobium arvi TaxID=2049916 RepID=A0ABP8MUP5_9BACT
MSDLNAKQQQQLNAGLPEDLRPAVLDYISEEQLLAALADRVAYMLQHQSGVFFQLMYKIDVREDLLREAMLQQDVNLAIAKLILDRRLASVRSKKENPANRDTDSDLSW